MKKSILFLIVIQLAITALFGQGLHISNWSNTGNNGNTLFAGDTVIFSYSVDNQDIFAHQNCEVSISSLNHNIEFLDSIETFDYIGAGNQYQFNNSFRIVVSTATPNGQIINFTILLKSDQGQYSEMKSFYISSCNLDFTNYTIVDNNNHNSLINASETDSILFHITNQELRHVTNVDLVLRTNEPNINIVSGNMHKDSILGQELFVFPTLVQANSNFVDGTTFDVFIDVLIDNQLQSTLIVSIIGTDNSITFEDDSYLDLLTNPINHPSWEIDNSTAFNGNQSLKSGQISHSDSTAVQYEFTTSIDGYISFAHKISTENNYDWLQFFIDGQLINRWSGLHDWEFYQHSIIAGHHVVKWIYTKDGSVSSNSDCVWIDDIRIPDGNLLNATFTVPTGAIERTLDRVNHNNEDVSLTLSNTSNTYILYANSIVGEDNNLFGWASVSPSNGSINAYQQKNITLHFTAEDQLPGDYHAFLEIRIDQIDSTVRIPLILHIQSLDGIDDHTTSIATNVYPNPTNGRFTIHCETADIQSVSIYDVSGKMILRERINDAQGEIDLSGKSKGIYFLKIETNQGTSNQKIIIQ